MSYSFSAKGSTKAAALEAAAEQFKKVVETQPLHSKDEAAARSCREAVVALIADEPAEGQAVYLSCSGSLSWRDGEVVTGASVSASASVSQA